uniref:Transmembrane protein n=1 Tax=Leuconostoc citreum TaxID=33964 RepID=A0A0A1ITX5_LEUCI|nr:Protein of unknown function [Leuconostoc citreum]
MRTQNRVNYFHTRKPMFITMNSNKTLQFTYISYPIFINQITHSIQHIVFIFHIKRYISINIKIINQRNILFIIFMLFLLDSVFRLMSKI